MIAFYGSGEIYCVYHFERTFKKLNENVYKKASTNVKGFREDVCRE